MRRDRPKKLEISEILTMKTLLINIGLYLGTFYKTDHVSKGFPIFCKKQLVFTWWPQFFKIHFRVFKVQAFLAFSIFIVKSKDQNKI